jgi:hypothetical protein
VTAATVNLFNGTAASQVLSGSVSQMFNCAAGHIFEMDATQIVGTSTLRSGSNATFMSVCSIA